MGKPRAPQAPDPVATATAQTASNRETAITQTGLNAINQTTPQGNLTYSQSGTWADGTPRFSATTTLSPAQQRLYETGLGTQQNLADLGAQQSRTIGNVLARQFDTEGLPAAGNPNIARPQLRTSLGANDYSADRRRVEDALMARLNPQIERDRAAQEASLANRGIRMGSTNYSEAQDQFGRNVNDARLGAILGAGDEQTRMQGLELNAANFGNNALQQDFANRQTRFNLANGARSQALNERLTTRNQALNENIGLATGSQVQMPQFGATPQTGVGGTDIAGINANAQNAALAGYNSQMQQYNSTMGGLFGLGASLIGMSDRRLKTNIEDTGEDLAGVPIKDFTWKDTGKRDRGVIAQEVEKKYPHLVEMDPSGYRKVNYGRLMQLGAKMDAQRGAA